MNDTTQLKKSRRWPYVLLIIFAVVVGSIGYIIYTIKQLTPESIVQSSFVQQQIINSVGEEYRDVIEHAPVLLGFEEPKTYLILFLNNTEMRPGGGFIGSYATVRMTKGHPEVLVLEGTEVLDGGAPKDWRVEPPAILTKELGVDRWYFRDSNWDPDFASNATRLLNFYSAEQGVAAEDIDMVIAVTPTVLEAVMKRVGNVELQGLTFTPENVVEVLEYDVEYGYEKRGISFADRKQIMQPFFHVLVEHLQQDVLLHPKEYLALVRGLIDQKHIMAYSTDAAITSIIDEMHAAGKVAQTEKTADYLLWVDANLAALKTDHAMTRVLSYTIVPQETGLLLATANMTYTNNGVFDWRTTRYRTFARVYVPEGAVLKHAILTDAQGRERMILAEDIEQGRQFEKQWFGYFTVIEPGDTEALAFVYELPSAITTQIATGSYHLTLQKQLGLPTMGFIMNAQFTKPVQRATPAEEQQHWGDNTYTFTKELTEDVSFDIGL